MSSDKKNLTYQSIGALLRVRLDKRGFLLDIAPCDAGHLTGVRWHRIQLVDLWSFLDLKKTTPAIKTPVLVSEVCTMRPTLGSTLSKCCKDRYNCSMQHSLAYFSYLIAA